MNRIATARARLNAAIGLPAVLDAAYDAFEDILSVLRHHEERAGHAFPAFVLAAGAAANGRDWAGDAPSLPPATATSVPAGAGDLLSDRDWAGVATEVAALSQLLAVRLTEAAGNAISEADQAACQQAARHAARICELLAGASQP